MLNRNEHPGTFERLTAFSALVIVVGALGLVACGASDGPGRVDASRSTASTDQQISDAQVMAIARDAATENGDPKATIEWVRTSYADAYALNEGVDKADEDHRPVVLVQVHGTFETDDIAQPPKPDASTDKAPSQRVVSHGTILRLTLDATTGETRIFNFTSTPIELEKLGAVKTGQR